MTTQWDEEAPVSRPWMIEEDIWGAIPPGARIRYLRWGDVHYSLSGEQYLELERLPLWTLYGPENGLPENWFNPRGYLLPKYRPGGSRYEEFRAARRSFRARSLVGLLVARQCQQVGVGLGRRLQSLWLRLTLLALFFAGALALAWPMSWILRRLGMFDEPPLSLEPIFFSALALFLFIVAVVPLGARIAVRVSYRWLARIYQRRALARLEEAMQRRIES